LRITLIANKPRDPAYPKEIRTLGDQIKTKRLDLNLTREGLAVRLGVTEWAVRDWEIGRAEVQLRLRPRVYLFLGIPDPETLHCDSLSERLTQLRLKKGLSLRALARLTGSSVLTLKKLQNDETEGYRWPAILKRLQAFLDATCLDEPPQDTEKVTRE